MPIPNFQMVMLPLLQDLASGERTGQETLDALAEQFSLTPEESAVRLPSGKQSTFTNRVAWAKSHMKAAGLIESPRRGVYRLTERGRQVLAARPTSIGMSFLSQYPEYVAFRQPSAESSEPSAVGPSTIAAGLLDERTPDDLIDDGYRQLRTGLVKDLRERIAAMAPSAFEQLVVDLLTAMGYGGPQEDAGLVVGRGGDEGIDGLIKEDKLGLETIYIQAKRWQGVVGRPEIQRFAGALQGQRARKGVFITSSNFTSEARAYAGAIQTTIVLVDGAQLAELMIDHDVGVTTAKRLDIKRVDSDYFTVE
jgi:restriction system protein